MRDKKRLFLFIVFAFLFTFPTVIMAQGELTETYTSADGKFTINYPTGWKVNDKSKNLIGFNGDGALIQISFYDSANSGYAPVTALEMLEVGIGEGPEYFLGFTKPEESIIAGYPALSSRTEMLSQLETVIDFGNGLLGTVIGFAPDGALSTFEPTFMAMMESIHYGDGPPPIVKSALDDIKAITPANAPSLTKLMTLGDEAVSVESVAFSPDGKLLAVGTSDGTVTLWNIASGESQSVLKGHTDGATSVAFDSGGYNLAVGSGGGQVRLWDVTSGQASGMLQKHSTRVESVAFHEFVIASGALDGSVKLWDMIANGEKGDLVESSNPTPVKSLAFNTDGTILAAGGGSTIRLWDVEAKTAKAVLETDIGEISSLSFRPDGAALVYGGSDPAAWVWDLENDNHVLLEGHVGSVLALTFSPDGQVIASGDSGSVRLWDAANGSNLGALANPSGQAVNSVAFNADGTLLASGGEQGGVVVWGTTAEAGASPASADEPTGDSASQETTTSASACTISAPNKANLRSGPGTEFDRAGSLSAGQTSEVNGQAQGADGMTWYRLADGTWVRSDVVGSPAECANVPVVTP